MDLGSLLARYGYWMVAAGALAEGESVLLLAGFAAHRGLLELGQVILVAAVASAVGDQVSYGIGRRWGDRLFARWPSAAAKLERLRPHVRRHPNVAVFAVRFIYGLRTAGPAALGALGVSHWKFTLLNLSGAATWAALFSALGYQFGNALQWLLDDLHKAEEALLATGLAAVLGWAVWRRLRRRRV